MEQPLNQFCDERRRFLKYIDEEPVNGPGSGHCSSSPVANVEGRRDKPNCAFCALNKNKRSFRKVSKAKAIDLDRDDLAMPTFVAKHRTRQNKHILRVPVIKKFRRPTTFQNWIFPQGPAASQDSHLKALADFIFQAVPHHLILTSFSSLPLVPI